MPHPAAQRSAPGDAVSDYDHARPPRRPPARLPVERKRVWEGTRPIYITDRSLGMRPARFSRLTRSPGQREGWPAGQRVIWKGRAGRVSQTPVPFDAGSGAGRKATSPDRMFSWGSCGGPCEIVTSRISGFLLGCRPDCGGRRSRDDLRVVSVCGAMDVSFSPRRAVCSVLTSLRLLSRDTRRWTAARARPDGKRSA